MCCYSSLLTASCRVTKQPTLNDYTKDLSLFRQESIRLLCIYTDSRQRNGADWFTDFWSLFLQFWLQLREDVEVILQYGIHPKRSCRKITPSSKSIPIFALQYIARGNHFFENYNELEERHNMINKWKYVATKLNIENVRTVSADNSVWRKIKKKKAKLAKFVTFVPTIVTCLSFPLLKFWGK